jgi:outer membrane protein OmpA-like peptidoglycan-associated protein
MFSDFRRTAIGMVILVTLLALSAQFAFGQGGESTPSRAKRGSKATSTRTIPNGEKATIEGNVTRVGDSTISVCDEKGAETVVQIAANTRIEMGRGFLRTSESRDKTALLIGLLVEVKGTGNDAGQLVAKSVKFRESHYNAETQVDARAIPLEKAQDTLADQLEETTIIATGASKDVKVAQAAADKAQSAANQAQGAADKAQSSANVAKSEADKARLTAVSAHERLEAIDDFDVAEDLNINFRVNSAVLTKEAKANLEAFAAKAVARKGYIIEISAFSSGEGAASHNHRLSKERAEAVMDYLIDVGKVPPRRMSIPYSGGENNPIGDNKTRAGRNENRRAEVKLLVSKGLASKGSVVSTTP